MPHNQHVLPHLGFDESRSYLRDSVKRTKFPCTAPDHYYGSIVFDYLRGAFKTPNILLCNNESRSQVRIDCVIPLFERHLVYRLICAFVDGMVQDEDVDISKGCNSVLE